MKNGLSLALILAMGVMVFSQSFVLVEAAKLDKTDPRKQAEQWTKEIDAEKKAKSDAIKAAWDAFKIAKTSWESAKQALKTAIQSGVQSQIDTAQASVDAAKIVKDNAWDNYIKEIRK